MKGSDGELSIQDLLKGLNAMLNTVARSPTFHHEPFTKTSTQ